MHIDTFMVKYIKKHRSFIWEKFVQQKFFRYLCKNQFCHVEAELQFTIKPKKNLLVISELDSRHVRHSIRLPALDE